MTLLVNPHKTAAGASVELTATLTLNGSPIAGAPVRLRMLLSPGSDFDFTPASGITNADGFLKARVRISRVNGDSIIQAESGLFSDQDHVQGTGGDAPESSVRRVNTGGLVPLAALGLLALVMLAVGVWINVRSLHRPAG
jgi:hypothetical protein